MWIDDLPSSFAQRGKRHFLEEFYNKFDSRSIFSSFHLWTRRLDCITKFDLDSSEVDYAILAKECMCLVASSYCRDALYNS